MLCAARGSSSERREKGFRGHATDEKRQHIGKQDKIKRRVDQENAIDVKRQQTEKTEIKQKVDEEIAMDVKRQYNRRGRYKAMD